MTTQVSRKRITHMLKKTFPVVFFIQYVLWNLIQGTIYERGFVRYTRLYIVNSELAERELLAVVCYRCLP